MTDQQNAVAVFDPDQAKATLVRQVDQRRPQLAALLSIDPETERGKAMLDRFVTVSLHAATSNPDLLRCTTDSLVEAVRQSAILGLEPTGALGDGALVVYNEKVKRERRSARKGAGPNDMVVFEESVPTARFQPMYRGLLKLARRSDQILVIDSNVVYEGDLFEVEMGTSPSVRHVPWPMSGEKDRGGYLGAYAFAELRTGRTIVEWMTLADIEAVRKTSRASSGPWVTFWAEMARKTVLRRLMKRLPLESAAEHAVRLETEAESASVRIVEDAASAESAASAGGARERLRKRLGVSEPDEEAGTPPPAGSVDPSASDQETEGTGRAICGAESDPALGAVEYCVLPPDHLDDPAAPLRHQSEAGAVWPVEKEAK